MQPGSKSLAAAIWDQYRDKPGAKLKTPYDNGDDMSSNPIG